MMQHRSVQAVVSRWEQQLLSVDLVFFLVNFQKKISHC